MSMRKCIKNSQINFLFFDKVKHWKRYGTLALGQNIDIKLTEMCVIIFSFDVLKQLADPHALCSQYSKS